MEAGPDRIAEMLAELMTLFAGGALAPLPVKAFDARSAADAYRFVSQARHIGKVVLTMPDGPRGWRAGPRSSPAAPAWRGRRWPATSSSGIGCPT